MPNMLFSEGKEIRPDDVTEADFDCFISVANDAVVPFDLEIRSTYHQLTRQRVYALVNSVSDPVTQLATCFTPDEISFVKRVLDAMFETNNTLRREVMAIKPIQATKLHRMPSNRRETQNEAETQGSSGQSLTMLQAEKVLKSLVEQGWFEKSKKDHYSLSPRALMELRGWLMATYNEEDSEDESGQNRRLRIKTCYACKEIVTIVSSVWFSRRKLTLLGSKMCQTIMSVSNSRCMRTKSIPHSKVSTMSYLQNGVERR